MANPGTFSHHMRVVVKPSFIITFGDIMEESAKASRKEVGCLDFVVLKDASEPSTYCIRTTWKSNNDWVLHKATAQYIAYDVFSLSGGILSTVYSEEYNVVLSI